MIERELKDAHDQVVMRITDDSVYFYRRQDPPEAQSRFYPFPDFLDVLRRAEALPEERHAYRVDQWEARGEGPSAIWVCGRCLRKREDRIHRV